MKKLNKTIVFLLIVGLIFVSDFETKAEEVGTATAPTVTFSSNFKSTGWNTEPFTFTISGSSIPEGPLKCYDYKINNGFWTPYNGPVTFNTSYSGDIILEVRAVEVNGKSYSIISKSYIATFKYDDQKPLNCEINTYNGKVYVSGDDWHSGVKYYGISKSNTEEPTEWSINNEFSVDRNDYSSYYGWIKDAVGFMAVSSNSISAYRSISDCEIRVEEQTYTGEELTPTIWVTYNGTTMIEGQDYNVSYSNNVNAGNGNVIITGLGYYCGSASTTFKINKAQPVFTITAIETGRRAPDFKLNYKLEFGDGKLSYKSSNNKVFKVNKKNKFIHKAPGIAYLLVSAPETDNFIEGTWKVKVLFKPTYMAWVGVSSKKSGQISINWITWDDGSTGYKIQVSTSKKFTKKTTKTYTVKGENKSSKTIKGLKKGKNYFVRVCSYKTNSAGTIYGVYSSKKSIKVKK